MKGSSGEQSRRSSMASTLMDSIHPEIDSPASTSTAGYWKSPYRPGHIPNASSWKRHSLFSRQRQNELHSISAPCLLPTPSTSCDLSRLPSGAQAPVPMETRRKTRATPTSWRDSLLPKSQRLKRSTNFSEKSADSDHADSTHEWRGRYKSEEAYYQHLRKLSISPPFNFQHIIHTHRHQIPELKSISQKDLVAGFWAASASQAPRHELQGIRTEDLVAGHDSINTTRSCPNTRPASPSFPPAPTRGRQYLHTPTVPDTAKTNLARNLPASRSGLLQTNAITSGTNLANIRPTRSSSLGGPDQAQYPSSSPNQFQPFQTPPVELSAHYTSTARVSEDAPDKASRSLLTDRSAGLEAVPEEAEAYSALRGRRPQPPKARSKSRQAPRERMDRAQSLKMPGPEMRAGSHIGSRLPYGNAFNALQAYDVPSPSYRPEQTSSWYSSATTRMPLQSSPTSWEEDVDLSYKLEAEATCNFNWGVSDPSRNDSMRSDDSVVEDLRRRNQISSTIPPRTASAVVSGRPPEAVRGAAAMAGSTRAPHLAPVPRQSFSEKRMSRQTGATNRSPRKPSDIITSPMPPLPSPPTIMVVPNSDQETLMSSEGKGLTSVPLPPMVNIPSEELLDFNFASFDISIDAPPAVSEIEHSPHTPHSRSHAEASHETALRTSTVALATNRWPIASAQKSPDLLSDSEQSDHVSKSAETHGYDSQCDGLTQLPPIQTPSRQRKPHRPHSSDDPFVDVPHPHSPQDQELLEAAGRAVQRGRTSRPQTPTSLSTLSDFSESYPRAARAADRGLRASRDLGAPCRVLAFSGPSAGDGPAWI
ncbi:hypothetical protein LTR66_011075 [Elasticomyces elasticus]|nr:hypothetical protein LTR66_011075 [Elasticomyces elasticus]